jgi:hypothetical protein
MCRHRGRLHVVRGILLSAALIALGPPAAADGPADKTKQADATLMAVHDKGERLIKALATTNHSPKLFRGDDWWPLFPTGFDWKEYARVREAIKGLADNSEQEWPSIVEHMTDTDYCFTVRIIEGASNFSRGDVCVQIARSWLVGGDSIFVPDSCPEKFMPPFKGPKELQKWCRARRDKSFVEIQIEAADLAVATIRKEHPPGRPSFIAHALSDLQKRAAKLRKTNRPIPGTFFRVETYGWYSEEDAAHYRAIAEQMK